MIICSTAAGPGVHLGVGEACAPQYLWPANACSARQPGVVQDLRLPVGQHWPSARPRDPARLGVGRGRVQEHRGVVQLPWHQAAGTVRL